MDIRILLCDDNAGVLRWIHGIIEGIPGTRVVGEAGSGRKAVEMTRELSPDMVLMDVVMPDLNGIEATRDIVKNNPGVKVLGVSMHADRRFVKAMLEAGASGYILKGCTAGELINAIRTLLSGRTYISPETGKIPIRNQFQRIK